MSWQIGGNFNPEIWDNVRDNLAKFNRFELVESLADAKAQQTRDKLSDVSEIAILIAEKVGIPCKLIDIAELDIDFSQDELEQYYYRQFKDLPNDVIIEAIIERIEDNDSCSNGGFEFYIDADGYRSVSTKPQPKQEELF